MSTQSSTYVPQPLSFAFTPAYREKAAAAIAKYPEGRQASACMALLDLAQRQEGWLSRAAMDHVAETLGMPPIRVYEVATFYTMYVLQPIGKHHVQVCTNLPCWLRGSDEILRACKDALGVSPGETTSDGLFTVNEVECAGTCVNAPMIQVGDDTYEDLDYESAKKVLEALKRGEKPKVGSQTGRQCSCPAGGPTTLKKVPGADVKGGA
ncbi:MAG: NAD(P)H-dependent oxidoreductase subunit E [Alphaproteobacteria bacterium]|nr:NAD(P)H-dependent oxidoreductase subunit E [Alphaproteobacteria bacterium]MBF0128356.1 NAD(P)H-dependent oxidoreductase subunit E [Alphaproteobacteria bacterium]